MKHTHSNKLVFFLSKQPECSRENEDPLFKNGANHNFILTTRAFPLRWFSIEMHLIICVWGHFICFCVLFKKYFFITKLMKYYVSWYYTIGLGLTIFMMFIIFKSDLNSVKLQISQHKELNYILKNRKKNKHDFRIDINIDLQTEFFVLCVQSYT